MSVSNMGQIIRYISLVLIVIYGALIAFFSQAASLNYRHLAESVLRGVIFYFFMVAIYCWIMRLKNWKFLLLFSLVIFGFVLELTFRAYWR